MIVLKPPSLAFTMLSRIRRALSLVTVEPCIFFYFLAIFLLYSVFQPFVYSRVCLQILADYGDLYDNCTSLVANNASAAYSVNEETNYWIKISSICFVVPSLFGDLVIGSWSDRLGRRLPLYLPRYYFH